MNVLEFDMDAEDTLRTLDALTRIMAAPRRLLGEAGRALEQKVRTTFRTESDPFGNAWAPHSPVTRELRARKGSAGVGLLFDSGAMFASIRSEADDAGVSVLIGGPGMWPGIHQRGNPNNRMFGRGLAPIPARPMLPPDDTLPGDWLDAALQPFSDAIEKAIA